MKCPNFNEEKKLWRRGYKYVAGLDEAGRGPLAGPVVAAAVMINPKSKILNFGVNDSKKLTAKQREELYDVLTNHKDIKWGVAAVSEKVIDRINILEATKLAMIKAVRDLEKKVNYLLIDGNFSLNIDLPQKSIIKGDQKVFSISCASIIAKVTRDRIMKKYHKKYPDYGFDRHKGYPTKAHFANLKKFGPCKIHRKSYAHIDLCFYKSKKI